MSVTTPDMNSTIAAGSASSIGRVRTINEDRFLLDPTNGWFAIADGVGGLPYGERASECAIRQLIREISRPGSATRDLSEIVASCHESVRQLGSFLAPRLGIGTTLTILRISINETSKSASLAHIGDSIAYLHPTRIHPLVKLSTDHISFSTIPVFNGVDTPAVFKATPCLIRYVGQPIPPLCDIHRVDLATDDRLILCSDGVTNPLEEDEIFTLSKSQASASALAQALVRIADLRGGLDNATALVMDIP